MIVRIADLDPGKSAAFGQDLVFDGARWGSLLETLRALKVLDEAMLDQMSSAAKRVEVTKQQARAIGGCLERWICRDLERQYLTPPAIPSCIVPIATSNGLWIDPALPLLNRRPKLPGDLILFVVFCLSCKGFAVN